MNELEITSKVALANTFVMYFKAHSYHWNVEGKNFGEYHGFTGDIYGEVYGAVDPFAEHIRTLDFYAPISLEELYKYKTIQEDLIKPGSSTEMLSNLLKANDEVLVSLNRLFASLSAANKQGFANFVADRIDAHEKHGWMLRSYLKSVD